MTSLRPLTIATFFVLTAITFNSCKKIDAAQGEIKSQRFDVEDFDKIRIETAGTLNYTQSSERLVEVDANDKILDLLDIRVEDETLIISFTKNKIILNDENIVFTVSDDDVYYVETTGSADANLNFDEGHDFSTVHLITSGSGNIELDAINAENSNLTSTGSGNINVQTVQLSNKMNVDGNGSGSFDIAGSSSELSLSLSGSGNFGEHDFISDKVVAYLSGSGNANVSVSYDLNAQLSGSGNLVYKGFPTLFAAATSGSGQVINGN